jgi:hypothetical protein
MSMREGGGRRKRERTCYSNLRGRRYNFALFLIFGLLLLSYNHLFSRLQRLDCVRLQESADDNLIANKELRPLFVFWDTVGDNRPEYAWTFNVLLAKVERPIIIIKNETDLEKHIHNVDRVDLLYVYSEMAAWEEYSKFFQNNGPRMMRERFGNRLKMGLFQLSDERVLSTRFYDVADYVYRNYWSAELETKLTMIQQNNTNLKVQWMILGFSNVRPYSKGILLPASMRAITCNFYGLIRHGNREQLMEALGKQPSSKYPSRQETITCEIGNGLDQHSYHLVLHRSIFTLCPTGYGDETYRVAEALDSGSIPIMTTTYYSAKWLSSSPLIILESWDGILQVITSLIANTTHLDLLQAQVLQWWYNYKNELKSQIAQDIGY